MRSLSALVYKISLLLLTVFRSFSFLESCTIPFFLNHVSFTGTHWMHEILSLLIGGKLTYNLTSPAETFIEWMEYLDRDTHGNGPVLYYTHLPIKLMPEHTLNKVRTKFNNIYNF